MRKQLLLCHSVLFLSHTDHILTHLHEQCEYPISLPPSLEMFTRNARYSGRLFRQYNPLESLFAGGVSMKCPTLDLIYEGHIKSDKILPRPSRGEQTLPNRALEWVQYSLESMCPGKGRFSSFIGGAMQTWAKSFCGRVLLKYPPSRITVSREGTLRQI